MDRIPKSGELYRHFKNKLYQIVSVATHSETREKLVIYQALYGDYEVYARPLEMFIGEVDHVKYPDVKQKYRFEKIERAEVSEAHAENNAPMVPQMQEERTVATEQPKQETVRGNHWEGTGVNAKLLAFLDADSMNEKYEILKTMRDEVTDQIINNMAVTLDVVIPDGDVQDRYEQLKHCIRTKQRYEIERNR